MKILRFGLLLIVLMGLVSMAAAATSEDPDYVHSFTALSGTIYDLESPFAFNSKVMDDVTVSPLTGYSMSFSWSDPSGRLRQYTTSTPYEGTYSSVLRKADRAGTWTVTIVETPIYQGQMGSFVISNQEPEFTYGSFIALLFAGGLYFILRRNLVGSFNANR